MRLELTRPNGHYPLKVARLPIPPPGQVLWSDKRDSDPRPRPWQGRALPTELLSQKSISKNWSDRRDSDPRPRPWQGRALPTELLSQKSISKNWSDRRDSDPRPRPWQGRALPTELLSQIALVQALCRNADAKLLLFSELAKFFAEKSRFFCFFYLIRLKNSARIARFCSNTPL